MNWRKRIKRRATYLFVRLITGLFNVIPRRAAMFVGAAIGLLAYHLMSKERYKTLRHLSLVIGDTATTPQRERLARQFFINSGKNLADVLRFQKHYERQIKPMVDVEGLHHLEAAYQRGRGVVGITGHVGNFELLAVHMAGLGYPAAAIGRDLYDTRLAQLLIENREAMGVRNLSTAGSPRKVLQWLKAGNILGVLIDIDSIRVRSEFVPSLGRMAFTPVGQSLLGLRAGAAFVPVVCLRKSDNRYRIVFEPEVTIDPTGDADRDAITMTAACIEVLDRIILQNPDQWIWLKNRWLTAYPKKS